MARIGETFATVHQVVGVAVNLLEDALPVVFKGGIFVQKPTTFRTRRLMRSVRTHI